MAVSGSCKSHFWSPFWGYMKERPKELEKSLLLGIQKWGIPKRVFKGPLDHAEEVCSKSRPTNLGIIQSYKLSLGKAILMDYGHHVRQGELGEKLDKVGRGLDSVQRDIQSVNAKVEALSKEKEERPKVSGRSSQFYFGEKCEILVRVERNRKKERRERHGRRGEEPIDKELDMERKRMMRNRFVPPSYTRDLHNKLERLYQGSRNMKKYHIPYSHFSLN
ncbi:hypothetical protein CR513_43556, partial [Mucuna pruriens]